MTVTELLRSLDTKPLGAEMHDLVRELFPLCRSITGAGVRETLMRLGGVVPITLSEVASGSAVLDWTVPREWRVRDAWVKGPDGTKVIDFARSNLHLVSYSAPFRGVVAKAELDRHLHSLPDRPRLVPYRTTYYKDDWGFCLADADRRALPEGDYEVMVDTELFAGSLTYGEHVVKGRSDDTVLISCHVCHPSLANDNLSSMAVTTALARELAKLDLRYNYRFVYLPGTIGSITWLAGNPAVVATVRHGLVAANLGDPGRFHYKRSRRGGAVIDRAVEQVLRDAKQDHVILDFVPFGYDERQYCSPGYDLAVGSLTRTPHGQYPEYHTSGDTPDFVTSDSLAGSLRRYLEVFRVLEGNRTYRNTKPFGEPQLGRRGLYRQLGGGEDNRDVELALLWVLNLADGGHDLLAMCARSGMSFDVIERAADVLREASLLEEVAGV